MARYAMVHEASGFVANVIEWDGETASWSPPPGYIMVLDDPPMAGPGWTYADGEFVAPPAGLPGTAEEPQDVPQ